MRRLRLLLLRMPVLDACKRRHGEGDDGSGGQ
jgi:hypothetical protein